MNLHDIPGIIFATSKASDGGMGFLTTSPTVALQNRRKFLRTLGIDIENAVGLYQQHGDAIVKVRKKDKGKGATPQSITFYADALITNANGLYLTVLAADCNQIALFDPKQSAIALIHAGRKGLELKIAEKTVKKMKDEFTTNPLDILAEFGPSIGPCCYMMDIWQEAENQLGKSGVRKKNIYNPRICTYHMPGYFSHRRCVVEKSPTDPRFITVLGLKKLSSRWTRGKHEI